MDVITDRTIEDEYVVLDNKTFIDCNLIDCVLEYSGGEVIFERTHISGCSYLFVGAANSTLKVLELLQIEPSEIQLLREHSSRVQ